MVSFQFPNLDSTGIKPNGVDLSSPSGPVPVEARLISYNVFKSKRSEGLSGTVADNKRTLNNCL